MEGLKKKMSLGVSQHQTTNAQVRLLLISIKNAFFFCLSMAAVIKWYKNGKGDFEAMYSHFCQTFCITAQFPTSQNKCASSLTGG